MTGQRRAVNPDEIVDHSVHGLVTIRFVGAPQAMLDRVEQLLGKSHPGSCVEPDITVRFIDKPAGQNRVRFIGLRRSAFDDESFYAVDPLGHRTEVDFQKLGQRCEITCEQGVVEIPLLDGIVALYMLQKEHVMLHSSSFVYRSRGILVAGWEKGGKTEMLLPFMAAGAKYMGDEWTIVSARDGTMRGVPGLVKIWGWQFQYVPEFWRRVNLSDRGRIRLVGLYQSLYPRLPAAAHDRALKLGWPHRLSLQGGIPELEFARCRPEALFGHHRVWRDPAPIDRLFFAVAGSDNVIRVNHIDPLEVAARMAGSLSFERRRLMGAYFQYRFAFPERRNTLLETANERERELLSRALANVEAFEISHPSPVALTDLHHAALPYCL